jgi:hypothetical protein
MQMQKKKMGLKTENLEENLNLKLSKIFQSEFGFVNVQDGVILPKKFGEIGDAIYNLSVRKDDIWLVSYPRTGLI